MAPPPPVPTLNLLVPPMVPPAGFDFIPPSIVGGQQFPTPAPLLRFNFNTPPSLVNLQAPLVFAPPGQALPFGGLQGLGLPMGLGFPPAQGIPQGEGVPLPPAPLSTYNVITDPVTPVPVRGHSTVTSPMASSAVRKKE